MRIPRISSGVALGLVTFLAATAFASQHRVLYAFTGGSDGAIPAAGLVADAAGNLYGTTAAGGSAGYGTVFKLTRAPDGNWTESVLHSFEPNASDGNQPRASLVLDASGALIGTTQFGGAYGEGTVFQVTPNPDGTWSETVLHSFDGTHGGRPTSSLILDASGNLYGTTYGSPYWCGTVFKLAPHPDHSWAHMVLHNFGRIKNQPGGGCQPSAGLVRDAAGSLYGTTTTGGANIYFGTVFRLTPLRSGNWKKAVLHSFTSSNGDGAYPYDTPVLDAKGNLYGTTYAGGDSPCFAGCGIVFRLVASRSGPWVERILHSFTGGADGAEPYAGLVFDAAGNLFGATNFGGHSCASGCGVIFELTRKGNGKWPETVLHSLSGNDGEVPNGNLVFDEAGDLFGTTLNGGSFNSKCPAGCGVVFQLKP